MADHLPDALKPFYHRANEAQDRLVRLEAALAPTKTDITHTKLLLEEITQIQTKLDEANEMVKQEQEKVMELSSENAKQKYRIKHLLQALKAADEKLENFSK